MKKFCFPEIPKTYLILILMIGMITMRSFGIDTWTTAMLSSILGWLVGVKMEQSRIR